MIQKVLSIINALIRRKSYWFNQILFQDCRKFWYLNTYHLDVVNLGSSSANAAFVYPTTDGKKCFNMAMSPQTFVGDYEVLRNYSCFLKAGATVLIPICPFSSLGGYDEDLADKYYSILNIVSFPHASYVRQQKIVDMRLNPIKYYPLIQLLSFHSNKTKMMSSEEIEASADVCMNSWKKQFSIYDWHYPLSLVNQDAYNDSAMQLEKIINYCIDHQFSPVVVLPPVSKELASRFTKEMRETYIYSFVKVANKTGALFLDYFDCEELSDDAYFADAFLLNTEGGRKFTEKVLKDLNLS